LSVEEDPSDKSFLCGYALTKQMALQLARHYTVTSLVNIVI